MRVQSKAVLLGIVLLCVLALAPGAEARNDATRLGSVPSAQELVGLGSGDLFALPPQGRETAWTIVSATRDGSRAEALAELEVRLSHPLSTPWIDATSPVLSGTLVSGTVTLFSSAKAVPLVALLTDLREIDAGWDTRDLGSVQGFGVIEISASPEGADASFVGALGGPEGTDRMPEPLFCPQFGGCKAARSMGIQACKDIANSAMLSCPIAAQECLAVCLPLIPIHPAAFAACAANCLAIEISCTHGVIEDFRACLIQVEANYIQCMTGDPHNHPFPANSVFPPV